MRKVGMAQLVDQRVTGLGLTKLIVERTMENAIERKEGVSYG